MEGDLAPDASGDHYFSTRPASPTETHTVRLTTHTGSHDLTTASGTFSPTRIDPGTRLLLMEAPRPPAGSHILDLGCGYGPISVALAAADPSVSVTAIDVNERALELCRANAASLGLANIDVGDPTDMAPDVTFDQLWSNPPIRIGKQALHDLLATWLDRLEPTGVAYLVVNKHLGSDSLSRWLETSGWAVTRLASRQGYRILEVRRA